MQEITKLCADHLRAFSSINGIKLKASHAHELVAAFFGYKSRAAMLADTQYPISNLPLAYLIVLRPSDPIDQRREELQNFPSNLPDSNTLCENVFTRLAHEKLIVATKIWSFHDLKRQAILLAHEYQHERQLTRLYLAPSHEEVDIESKDDGILFTITPYHPVAGYRPDGSGKNPSTSIKTTIWLKRTAGYIGYSKPEISARPIPMLVKAKS